MIFETLLDRYVESFPFPEQDGQRTANIEKRLGFTMSQLLRRLFSQIGEGNYWLTGEYFTFDDSGALTEKLVSNLEFEREPNCAEQFGLVPCSYECGGGELVIGECDDGTYFVEDATLNDPVVRCWIPKIGVVVDKLPLSSIVAQFRYFSHPNDVPQSIVDYEWFTRNIGFDLNPDVHHRNIKAWAEDGRMGMPSRYLGHNSDDVLPHLENTSVMSPGYFLW